MPVYACAVNEFSGAVTEARALPGIVDASEVALQLSESQSWFWLDGSELDSYDRRSTWSYLGVAQEVRYAVTHSESKFLDELRAEQGRADQRSELAPRGGFHAGWVVALSYEFGVGLLGEQPAEDEAAPAFALRAEVICAIDRETGRAELRGTSAGIDRWLAEFGAVLGQRPAAALAAMGRQDPAGSWPAPDKQHRATATAAENDTAAHWRREDVVYLADVEACREAIRAGDAYVLCLTDTAEVASARDPLALYETLRSRGGAIRGGVIVDGSRALVSASPERFLSAHRDATGAVQISTHPIKGTRPRGETPQRDADLAADLAADPKELAENLMIVDLMRNDLNRVCLPGSVRTAGFQRVESHPHVHQLVSTVTGTLRADRDVFDAIEACFPGGSMTGAPKLSAVRTLQKLEHGPRGLYSGCFGWIDRSGDAELAMTIRSAEIRGDTTRVGAGGGITIDSDAARELAEVRLKARSVLGALGVSVDTIL